jgi:hypothetical protein
VAHAVDPWDPGPLLEGIVLDEAPALAYDLARRLPPVNAPRAVSVTDLLDPRRAFWRRARGPAPLSVERELRLESGRRWHRALGDAIATEGRLEVRVRRGGLSARIDLLADVPVEIKTGAAARHGAPPDDWPEQLEQLAAYCVLSRRDVGRLAHVASGDEVLPQITVREIRFRELDAFRREIGDRERDLREAIASGDPDPLGRCRWFDRGCEYREAGVCTCQGDEPETPTSVEGRISDRTEQPQIADRWSRALAGSAAPSPGPVAHFRDLLYPRRAYFERTAGRPPAAHPPRPPAAPLDAYERTIAALEEAPVGEVHRLPGHAGAPDEELLGWNGAPCLVRASRVHGRLSAEEVRSRFPQYLLDLGFRCAASGTTEATLVIGYEVPVAGETPVQVFRVRLAKESARYVEALRRRGEELGRALADRAPGKLPACPSWMTRDCPYRETCGCASAPVRSQR